MSKELSDCPDKPNCVSSLSVDARHAIEPLSYRDGQAKAKQRLMALLAELPRTKLLADEGSYLHYSFTTLIMRFVDDVEFVFDDAKSVIHVRSASRVGHSDLGANRKRVEEIRRLFQ